MEETLSSSEMASERTIADCKREIDRLEKDLFTAKDNAQRYLDKFDATQKELDNYISKSKESEERKKVDDCEPGKRVTIKKENDTENVGLKQLDEHVESVTQLENNLETVAKLQRDIDQLNRNLETCQMEKKRIEEALDKNGKKLLRLENRLEETALVGQEKDAEIVTLQKELKHMIQKSESAEEADGIMEAKLKGAVNELTQTKETLLGKEQCVKELRIRLENFERNAKILNLLEENAKERQAENERLRNIVDELRTSLTEKEREMGAFMKNRDETVTKYETLVKNQQEELERQKREVMRYQELFRRQLTPTPNKDDYKKLQSRIEVLQEKLRKYEASAKTIGDDCDTTSEEEIATQRQVKRRGKKTAVLSVKQENIPVIELSESDSKRSTRRTALPPPETSTEKRSTRRKKLFLENESFTDIEPIATPAPTRNLRNRKK